ncbi:vacuolar transporter chaperone [Entomophthora muscae]|uniref:Vacuolar transporter chaperone n=1 Tax=Entomophthora muscae TaxID=34485 RepID=A0ACC2TMD5_9FUNG|nr:vacuolar transporter chaperone [Entomophthora muscae]
MELKLYILKFLPVLIYNASSDADIADPAITSIYFDNESFDLYLGRLEKHEGAEAIRLRWYGPTTCQEIFVERKTHQEDWTGEKSVKQRFPLKEKNVNAFLRGEYSVEKTASKMLARGKSDKEVDSFRQLATEVQDRVLEKKLRPAVRSFYNRTAFQLPGDACVRISLDTELSLIREDNTGTVRAGENWRRTDIGTDWPFSQLPEGDICRFPYAILEVKLQTEYGTEPPVWVQRLIESHLVEAVPKFSKYIHGVATLMEDRVSLLPFWLPQMDVDIRREPNAGWFRYRDQAQLRGATDSASSNQDEEGELESDPLDELNGSSSQGVTGIRGLVKRLNRTPEHVDGESAKRIALPVRVEPKVFFANERTFLSWLHFGIVLSSLSLGLLNFGDKIGQVAASVFILISMSVLVYAVSLFYWRGNKIRARQNGPYDDPIGPLILVISLFFAMAINFYLKVQARRGNLPPQFL